MKRLEGLANGLKTSETLENKKGRNQVFGVGVGGGVHNRYEGEVRAMLNNKWKSGGRVIIRQVSRSQTDYFVRSGQEEAGW